MKRHKGTAPRSEPREMLRDLRKRPVHCVHVDAQRPTIVYLTVCTKDRRRWLACAAVHSALRAAWVESEEWLVGRYVVLPDHLHLFAAPSSGPVSFDNWVRYWKSRFRRRYGHSECRWQSGYWDTTLRSEGSYDSKWAYVRNNPVRHGLVRHAEEWPYQGELHALWW